MRSPRQQLDLKDEVVLALLPTVIILAVLGLLEVFSRQRLLFASLASSAFLIYLDPYHGTNTIRTLVVAHFAAAVAGLATSLALGEGYTAGGSAMILTIGVMIFRDAIHPPAVSTALSFAFRANAERSLVLFGMALGLIVVLIFMQRGTVWLLVRLDPRR